MSGVRVPQRPPNFQPVNINFDQCLQAFLIFTTQRLYFWEHSKTGWFWVNESPKRNPKTFFGLFHDNPVFIGYYCILSRFWGVFGVLGCWGFPSFFLFWFFGFFHTEGRLTCISINDGKGKVAFNTFRSGADFGFFGFLGDTSAGWIWVERLPRLTR